MPVYEIIHTLNAVAAAFVLGLVILRGRRWYSQYSVREKVFHNGFVLYAFASAYISAEGYFLDFDTGAGPFIIFAANIYALFALVKYKEVVFVDVKHPML